tara:strand:+ start:149 stop:1264 length:1116 start_codon:yes stop_codon:yes gene_type:complete
MNLKNSDEKDLKYFLNKKKFNRIFIVTGKNSFYKSGISKIINFNDNEKLFKFYFKISYLPEIEELKKLVVLLDEYKPDLVLAIGGGGVMDLAKIANIVEIVNLKSLKKMLLDYQTPGKKKKYPLIAIPTTAGSGAEVTSNAVIYINKIKHSVESQLLLPNYYFLLPKLIIGNPKKLKSDAGFDVIAQSIESLISVKSNKSSIYFAKQSLILSSKNYLSFIDKPTKTNSENMILAANLAGKAINISKTTAPHAVSYPFTSIYGINHGHAVSLTLEKFLYFNYENKKYSRSNFDLGKRYKIIFDIFNAKNINELCEKIKFIKKNANLEDNFKLLGININKKVGTILNQINILRLKNNPIDLSKNDLMNIILKK